MERSITFSHKKHKRQFIVSSKSKPNTLKNLIKKAFNLQLEIKNLRSLDGKIFTLSEIILQNSEGEYQLVIQQESSDDRSKSEVCSQKNMSKVSGRKNPPSQNELLDSKFYIDDFQLFMSQVTSKKSNKFFGIVFFNSKKKASFLGKKILRQLIFQFDKIEFFYALHPIKMHTTSALLGDVLTFSLFRGKKMINERQFPQQITAADQIPNYIKNLIKIGEINFQEPINEQKKTKNLIKVHEQRSFDHQIENSPEKLSDFGGRPNRTAEIIKIKPITPEKDLKIRKKFTNPKQDSPIKSHITNQISFENDFFQPEWFFEGDVLNRLQKGILSALIKGNDPNLITFLNGLGLKDKSKQKLNIKLVKVFIKEIIDEKFSGFSEEQRIFIEENQENRKSFVFTLLLKLYKFGDIKDFFEGLSKGLLNVVVKPAAITLIAAPSNNVIHYSSIAKNNDKAKTGFTIKLLDCEHDGEASSPRQHPSPFRQNSKLHLEHTQVANIFHSKSLEEINKSLLKDLDYGKDYDEAQRAGIRDLILKNDAFMIESFVRKSQKAKKGQRINSKIVRKYLREVEGRYDHIRQRTVVSSGLNLKMQKLQIFNGLLYFLYKQRIINKKQLKIAFYLYTWSDLNILAAFELYLIDRNVDQFVDTLYSIDYNYYLLGLYEIDHSQVEQFTLDVQSQLIILFLYQGSIDSGDERISLEKFIRAGDKSLLKLYTDPQIQQADLIKKMIELSRQKKEELDNINRNEKIAQCEIKEKKKERSSFIDQISITRLKNILKTELIKYCIMNDEPEITRLFNHLDSSNDQNEFLEALKHYSSRAQEYHMSCLLRQLAIEASLDVSRIQQSKPEILKGIYEAYIANNDKEDAVDSLERVLRKAAKQKVDSPISIK